MHVKWTSLGRLEAALTSVCWETATRPEPAAVALGSAWAAMASPAKVSMRVDVHCSAVLAHPELTCACSRHNFKYKPQSHIDSALFSFIDPRL